MLKLEKIEFKNPLKEATLRVVEYVVTHNGKVYFGQYSEPIQNFYEQSTHKNTLLESRSFSDLKPLFLHYYTPLYEHEYRKLILSKSKDLELDMHRYNISRNMYTTMSPINMNILQRRSILLQYLSNDMYPNNQENIEAIREHMKDVVCDIDDQLSSLVAKRPRLSYIRPAASIPSSVDA